MRTSLILLVGFLALSFAPANAQAPEPQHVPVPAGWTPVDEELRFDRDHLWEYINGAAELYLTYSFRELIVREVEKQGQSLSLSVYDMGRPLDAYGIFEREKPANARTVEGAGAAALVQPPYRALLLKDRWYVKVDIGGETIEEQILSAVLGELAAGLPGEDELPPQLGVLPETNRRPGTLAYAALNFLGLGELRNCVHAEYSTPEGLEYQLFRMPARPAFLAGLSDRWTEKEHGGRRLLTRQIPYRGEVLLLVDGENLVGISGIADRETALRLLKSQL